MKKEEKVEVLRHSLSHIMAAAVRELWPKVKFAIGPTIDCGFYYDFDFGNEKVGEDTLVKIEKKMNHIIRKNIRLERFELNIDEALERERKAKQTYKVELIKELQDVGVVKVSYYRLSDFEDLCRGPHVQSSGKIRKGSFKLTCLAGAYWRGDEKNKMLTRSYGVGFEAKKELDEYLKMMEEAEKRNHVKLGRELDLFTLHEEAPGFPLFHPKGIIIWQELMKYWKQEHDREGYQEIRTPIILRQNLWEQSGHWDNYKENMYFTRIDENDFAVKPMNCPGGIIYYKTSKHSYRELPLKVAEVGLVHRHELSGVLNGLLRVRAFHQDDAHIYTTEKQVKDEVIEVIKLIDRIYKTFNLEYHMELSTKPEKRIGTDKMWVAAEKALEAALKESKSKYKLNPGDGAFYGPKIDFHIKDAIGRTWQCGTIQLDFAMPERLNLVYTGKDGKEHKPAMLHRTVYGAIERFMGILIEHYAGAFPVWLSPVQVKIISVGADHKKYCQKLAQEFRAHDIRVEVDDANETVGNKIRKATKEKVPCMIVIGDKEIKSESLAVRDRGSDKVRQVGKKRFISEIGDCIKN